MPGLINPSDRLRAMTGDMTRVVPATRCTSSVAQGGSFARILGCHGADGGARHGPMLCSFFVREDGLECELETITQKLDGSRRRMNKRREDRAVGSQAGGQLYCTF